MNVYPRRIIMSELLDKMTAWRRELNMHPELSMEEHETAGSGLVVAGKSPGSPGLTKHDSLS